MILWLFSPFSPLPEPGSHDSRSTTLYKCLQDAGHEVVWFSMDWDHRRKKKKIGIKEMEDGRWEIGKEIQLIHVPAYHRNISIGRFCSHRTWGNRLVRTAKCKVKNGELSPPDLILASSPPLDAPRAAFRLQKHFRCQVKIDLTDLWPHSFSTAISYLPSPISRFLLYPLYKHAHNHWKKAQGISAMSQEYLDEVLRIVPGQDTHLCYIGGEVGGRKSPLRQAQDLREIRGQSPTQPPFPLPSPISHLPSPVTQNVAFLYLGSMTDSYDFDTLFDAAKILIAENHHFHIHIAGSGPLEETLKAEAKKIHFPTRHDEQSPISFHGFLDEAAMQELCSRCDIGLNIIRTGRHITMPHKLNDYLCNGLGVINSLPGEAENLLNTYHAGLTYPAGDPSALADCIRHYIQDPDKTKATQRAAFVLATELLDREKTYPEWVEWLATRDA